VSGTLDEVVARPDPPRGLFSRPRPDWVFIDIGGPLFCDDSYYATICEVAREKGGEVSEEEFRAFYAHLRSAQQGSFGQALLARFAPGQDAAELYAEAESRWCARGYRDEELYEDVPEAIARLRAAGFKLGLIANQPSSVRNDIERVGLLDRFEVFAISEEIGAEKPDLALFLAALDQAGCEASDAVMVGDRLDRDLTPAARLGMGTVWVLRNEAPDQPDPAQLAQVDAAVADLDGVASVLLA